MSLPDRLAARLVTGPVGRFLAFVLDLAAAVLKAAANKVVRR
ncbi:MAG TPA: hypothetical protein VHR37_03770 [Solirubrobacterales bacterium]|nr:hypothetical protein [Solirubrobacterales bacterium]